MYWCCCFIFPPLQIASPRQLFSSFLCSDPQDTCLTLNALLHVRLFLVSYNVQKNDNGRAPTEQEIDLVRREGHALLVKLLQHKAGESEEESEGSGSKDEEEGEESEADDEENQEEDG